LYSKRSVKTLQGSAFRQLGNNVSHGCVRLYVEDAKWLYYYACPGTTIEITRKLPSNRAMTKKLKTRLSFSEYNALQKKIYDNEELPNQTAWIVKDRADMRTGNGFNDSVLKRLKVGAEVEVLQSAEPWCKVKYDGREGYIRTAYLTFEKGTVNSKKDADIMRSIAWMYTEPSTKSKMIVRIPVFSSIKILEPSSDGWTKVQFWNETGYVQSKAITKGWGVIR
jgi:SH3-like domain-containing protein